MPTLEHRDSIVINATPQALYDMIADVTRMGEWSPICKACWWDEGQGPEVGSWFTGRNELPDRTWETRSQIVAAEPGVEFAWAVGGDNVRWGYEFVAVDGGTQVTESWEVLPAGVAWFHERFGEDADNQLDIRADLARTGIPQTLQAIKDAAEG